MAILRSLLFIFCIFDLGFILFGWAFFDTYDEHWGRKVGLSTIISITLFVVSAFSISQIHLPDEKYNIYSVKREGEIEGHFGIFGGSIHTEQYYFVYQKDKYGYVLEKYPANTTSIVEDEEDQPYVIEKDFWWKNNNNARNYKNIIHVPKGTLILEYRIE